MFDELRSNLRQAYAQRADQRDRRTIQPWKLEVRAHFLSLLHQEQKHTLLEIGAGTGLDSLYFQEQGLAVTCVDLSPGWNQYRTPIKGYYQCGSGTHPGGCVMGAPGKLAATQILGDLKK